jgi:hypothetical protein
LIETRLTAMSGMPLIIDHITKCLLAVAGVVLDDLEHGWPGAIDG